MGLPWERRSAALTANPADIFGIGAERGRIEKGKVADLVLWSGDPLEVTTFADQVWIAGSPIAMRSRQTELARSVPGAAQKQPIGALVSQARSRFLGS